MANLLFLMMILAMSVPEIAAYPVSTQSSTTSSLFMSSRRSTTSTLLFSSAAEEAERLQEQAQKLRQEIDAFQQKKDTMEDAERRKVESALDAKQAIVDRYSAVVPILKPDGTTVEEQVQFPPRLASATSKSSEIIVVQASLPLGMILGESETLQGMTVVDDIADDSNAQLADLRVGDLVRACTACRVEMEQPTWNLIVGGIGRPRVARFMYSIDYQPFEQVMEAVGSNRMDPDGRPLILVLERKTD
jgi:hypothetical protein